MMVLKVELKSTNRVLGKRKEKTERGGKGSAEQEMTGRYGKKKMNKMYKLF